MSVYVVTDEPKHDGSTILGVGLSLEDAQIVAEGHLRESELRDVTAWISGTDHLGRPTWWLGGANDLFITEIVPVKPIERTCPRCGRVEGTFACRIKHQHLNTGWAKSANDR